MKSILDRSFRYTPSVRTDVRKTFARIRREQEVQEHAQAQADAEAKQKVSPIRRARGTAAWRQLSPSKP